MTAGKYPEGDLFFEVVGSLTTAARRRDTSDRACDFAEFLAGALAATAANVGGPEELLAGRPGSWEAGYLRSLLEGTMGDEPDGWMEFRTEPVVVPLNVAEFIETGDWYPGLLGFDDAIAVVEKRYEWAENQHDLEAFGSEIDAVVERYTEGYRGYAERFESVVQAAAVSMGLPFAVTVEVDCDPQSDWWGEPSIKNPSPSRCNDLVSRLWSDAHDILSLPNVDVLVRER